MPFLRFILLMSILTSCVFHIGCFEDDIFESPTQNLSFSVDTVRFDTVFTSLGSATRSVKVINDTDQNVILKSIEFVGNEFSKFRMNVDGLSSEKFENIQIRANDSLYIFVEVTIDPNDPLSVSPFIIEDAISIKGGDVDQKIYLEAWGQNANYIPNRFNAGNLVRLTCDNQQIIWDDPRPYVIYGILFIDSCNIVIPAGTQIYFHGGLANFDGIIANDGALFFQENGILTTLGTKENPVVFQGDRLESNFSDVPGQWTGLRFLANSKNNSLQHTIIKNSIIGIRADSAASVVVDKTQIFNTSNAGIIGVHADVSVTNCLLHNNGSSGLFLGYGGNYDIAYTTLANSGNQESAIVMDNFLCLNSDCSAIALNNLNAKITNCIITGSGDDEILYIDATEGSDPEALSIQFENCLVKVDELADDAFFNSICNGCVQIAQGDSIFVNRLDEDFHLHNLSPAQNIGLPVLNISDDLENNIRDVITPDIGCYESS